MSQNTFPELEYDRNWNNEADFPTRENNETQVRADMQYLFDVIQTYINGNDATGDTGLLEHLVDYINQIVVSQLQIPDNSIVTQMLNSSDCNAPTASKLATNANRKLQIVSSDGTGGGTAVTYDGSGTTTKLPLPATIKAALSNALTMTVPGGTNKTYNGSANVTLGIRDLVVLPSNWMTLENDTPVYWRANAPGMSIGWYNETGHLKEQPAQFGHVLTIDEAQSGAYQLFFHRNAARIYFRKTDNAGTAWLSWEQLANTSDIPTALSDLSGTLSPAKGGTGQTTLGAALDALCGSKTTVTATPNDDTTYICQDSSGAATFWPRKHSALYNYIKSKLDSVVWAASNIPNLSAAKITSDTLGEARGGTGYTTRKAALVQACNELDAVSGTPQDSTYYISQANDGTTGYYRRPVSALYTYIKNKLDSVYAALSHNHAASAITSGTLGVARGGTGATTFTSGNALIGAGTNAVTTRAIKNLSAATAVATGTDLVNMNTLYYSTFRTAQIPDLAASKITSGTFGADRIADGAVTNAKLASGIGGAKITSPALATWGARRVYIGSSTPSSPATGDLWLVP